MRFAVNIIPEVFGANEKYNCDAYCFYNTLEKESI
jgi:hypothetical protein